MTDKSLKTESKFNVYLTMKPIGKVHEGKIAFLRQIFLYGQCHGRRKVGHNVIFLNFQKEALA